MAVIIRGAGDIATGIALRLHRAGFQIIMTDLPQPTSIRRTVCFSEALRLGEVLVEDVRAQRTDSAREALGIAGTGEIAVVADPTCALLPELYPAALVDAILAKRNLGTSRRSVAGGLASLPARTAMPPWRPCAATPWGGYSIVAHPFPTPGFPVLSAATGWSGYCAHRRQGCLSRKWRSVKW